MQQKDDRETRHGVLFAQSTVSSEINILDALSPEHVGNLAHPLVGDPLRAQDDRAAAVQHGHVRLPTTLDVVPEDGGVAFGRHGHTQPGEGGPPAPDHVGQVDHEGGHPVADDVAVVRVEGQVVGLLVDED